MRMVVLGGRLAQQALVRPMHLVLWGFAGSAAACVTSLEQRHSKLGRQLAWRCCWVPWWPCWGLGAVCARLLGDDTSYAFEGKCRSAAVLWEGWTCEWR